VITPLKTVTEASLRCELWRY